MSKVEKSSISPTALADFLVALEKEGWIHINREKLKLP
jgi:hypothetical protein